jgi:hypothetical protein
MDRRSRIREPAAMLLMSPHFSILVSTTSTDASSSTGAESHLIGRHISIQREFADSRRVTS